MLGIWLVIACFAYLALSLTGLVPRYEDRVFSITSPIMVGEIALMLWLVIRGVSEQALGATAPRAAGAPERQGDVP